jgi:hypothetical protein
MDFAEQQNYLNTVRAMADEAAHDYTDDQLLAMAMANIGEYIHDNSPHYILIEDDPRNEDDYDTWDVGMEPIPGDQTWKSNAIDVESSEVND